MIQKMINLDDGTKEKIKEHNPNHFVKKVQMRSFLWSVFSRIWTEHGDLRSKSPYSVRIWENTK